MNLGSPPAVTLKGIPMTQHSLTWRKLSILRLGDDYRNLNVLSENRAKMTAMIQKRTVTFVSGHPFNSK